MYIANRNNEYKATLSQIANKNINHHLAALSELSQYLNTHIYHKDANKDLKFQIKQLTTQVF